MDAYDWDSPGTGPNSLTLPADRRRIWAELASELSPAWVGDPDTGRVIDQYALFHHVDNVRYAYHARGKEVPDWYRQKYWQWVLPAKCAVTLGQLRDLGANLALCVSLMPMGWSTSEVVVDWCSTGVVVRSLRITRHNYAWQHAHSQDLMRVKPKHPGPPPELLWRRAVQAGRCIASMLALWRWLPRELCWRVIYLLELLPELAES